MKYSWIDYDKSYISFANSCLDDEAVHYTGCDDGWGAEFEYWKNDSEMVLNRNYWCKVVCENNIPIALIEFSLYEVILTIMEIIVAPSERGKGCGSSILKELLNSSQEITGNSFDSAKAVIYPDNIASQKAFTKAGFAFSYSDIDGDAWYYTYNK